MPCWTAAASVQQSRLAVKADPFEDKKNRESREDFAPDGKLGDIASDRVLDDPMRSTSFGDQECTEPPALSEFISDDALVNQDAEAPKPCLS